TRTGERGEEQSFAGEEGALQLADVLDVEVDRRLIRNDAACVDSQTLTGLQIALRKRTAGVHEHHAVAVEPLHDETFAAEETDAHPALKREAKRHTACRAEEALFLTEERAAHLAQMHGNDLARVGRGECHATLALTDVVKDRGEDRLARDEPLAGPQQ